MLASNWPSVDKVRKYGYEIIIQVNTGAAKALLDQMGRYHCSQVVMSVCMWGAQPVSSEGWQRGLFVPRHLPCLSLMSPLSLCPCKGGARVSLPAGHLALLTGHQSLGCSQGDGGNHVLHLLLGNQTTKRLKMTIKIKSFSTYLIVEPEWVFKLQGPFQPSAQVLSLALCLLYPHARKKGCWLPVLTWSTYHSEFQVLCLILIFKLAGILKLSSLCTTAVLLSSVKE